MPKMTETKAGIKAKTRRKATAKLKTDTQSRITTESKTSSAAKPNANPKVNDPKNFTTVTKPKPDSAPSLKKSSQSSSDTEELYHWADLAAENIIKEKGDKKSYTFAAGITPSGTVHIGNFREIITVDLVKRALEKRGKKVRFIYSWDNYDVFRKVPKNMPQPEVLQLHLRKSIVDTPDTFGCHKNYAFHNQAAVERDIPKVGIFPEFIYQAEKYRRGDYVKQIKEALENTAKIKSILNNCRDESLDDDWLPVTMFCEKCGKDTLTSLRWLGSYRISYSCSCGHSAEFDFQKKPLLKLKWRVDWPMRWAYEKVDFEPGGKDHSTAGGSYDTGKEIIKAVWHSEAPTYVMYDFINVKGKAGKMSSSSGEVIELADVLEIYEPEVIRYIFAGTRPNREFSISFDVDVLNVYEDFDKAERIYFSEEAVPEKDTIKYRSAYELSYIGTIPPKIPYQPGFRHLTTLLQIYNFDLDKVIGYFEKQLKYEHDRRRLRARAECAANWLKRYAPEEFRFHIQDSCLSTLSAPEKEILHIFADKLLERKWTDKELHEEIYVLCQSKNFQVKDFFRAAYLALINKERGPRLASFVLEIGKEKVAGLLKKA